MKRLRALRRPAVPVWLTGLLLYAVVIGRTSFTADLSVFLPRSPSAGQRVLVGQLREGLVPRLILVGIDGGDAATRATLSKQLAVRLRADAQFSAVNNGEPVSEARDWQFISDHCYVLSPAVTPQRFSTEGLHAALGESLDLLSSSAGLVAKNMLPRDPTGEVAALVNQLDNTALPSSKHGVWAPRDGQHAVPVVQTMAAGSDTDAQAHAIDAMHGAFDVVARAVPNAASTCILMTSPGALSVESRDTIRHDIERFPAVSLVLVVALLLTVYRSPRTVVLGLLPVLLGVAASVATVNLTFGAVHGLTLGLGTTLVGEAVDHSIYLFVQSARLHDATPYDNLRVWIVTYWPTIRLGVLTSVCGFASMLFSGFPGLVQLGLYSIVGLVAAALVTRYVLPHLRGAEVATRDLSRVGTWLTQATSAAPHLRWLLAAVLIGTCAVLSLHRDSLWSRELAALSPVPAKSQVLDANLRADVGTPGVRYLVVIPAATEQAALEGVEKIATQLQPLVDNGVFTDFENPARYLSSDATQRARLASLSAADAPATRMRSAVEDQPIRVKPDLFAPFIADVGTARAQPFSRRTDLKGTSMALAVNALLTEHAGQWNAMLPLRAPPDAPSAAPATTNNASNPSSLDTAPIRAAVEHATVPGALFVDMGVETDWMCVNYVREDPRLSLAGFAVIVLLLIVALRSSRRTLRALAPLMAVVLVVTAGSALTRVPLAILHLVGMLLIVAVGSNYALFFNQRVQAIAPQTLVSLLVANLTTVAGFSLLALSRVPMLETLGLIVGPGAVLTLLFAATLTPRANHDQHATA